MLVINMCRAGAFDYITDDVKILIDGILGLRDDMPSGEAKAKEEAEETEQER